MPIMDILFCLIIAVSLQLFGHIEGEGLKPSDESFIEDKVRLPLMYCDARRSKADQRQVSSSCLKIWIKKYEKYCKDSPHADSKACLKLKWRMKAYISGHATGRTRASDTTDYCKIGPRDKPFNTNYQFCCEGHIKKKKQRSNIICCSNNTFNKTSIQCCNKSEISLKSLKRAGCCRDELYDEDRYMCYGGLVLSKTFIKTPKMLEPYNRYNSKVLEGLDGTDYREKTPKGIQTVTSNTSSILFYSLIGFVVFAVISLTVVFMLVWYTRSFCITCNPNQSRDEVIITSFSSSGTNNRQHFESIDNILHHDQIETNMNKNNVNEHNIPEPSKCRSIECTDSIKVQGSKAGKTDVNVNQHSIKETINAASQTGSTKSYNLSNSMGSPFCCRHVFTSSRRSLKLPDSCVKLTVSEKDASHGTLECFASTFPSLSDVYGKLENVLTEEETIVSPAVEYVFPNNETLEEFGCVEMEIGRYGRDLHVWKIRSDQGTRKVESRQEIPLKAFVDLNDKSLDAFYDLTEPGKIRIYIKRFCWLVCTVCHGEHYGFNLAAYIYMSTVPQNNLYRKVRLTMYILDDIQQLVDYRKYLHENESNLKMVRNIQLPFHVKLEDNLALRFILFDETADRWAPQKEYPAIMDVQSVILHRITKCHKQKSNSQPYALDMDFICRSNDHHAPVFIFEGVININLDPAPPGSVEDIPENSFTVTHEVDFSSVRKEEEIVRHARSLNTDFDHGHPASYIQQPVSSPAIRHQRSLEQHSQSEQISSGMIAPESGSNATDMNPADLRLHRNHARPINQQVERNYQHESRRSLSDLIEVTSTSEIDESMTVLQNIALRNDRVFAVETMRMRAIECNHAAHERENILNRNSNNDSTVEVRGELRDTADYSH